jgi:hypothetical protein
MLADAGVNGKALFGASRSVFIRRDPLFTPAGFFLPFKKTGRSFLGHVNIV